MKAVRWACFFVVAELSTGCGPPHIRPFTPRERKYDVGKYAATERGYAPAEGSIYSEAQAAYLEDTRALRVGDIVRIRINEQSDAQGGASTNLKKDTGRDAGVDAMLGLVPAIKKAYPNIDPAELVKLAASYDFNGEGKTQRAGRLRGTMGVRVKKELPNGDLFVEGTKVVMIGHEEQHLYVSGIVRPADIRPDDTVSSTRIAEAEIELVGRGDLTGQQRPGWLSRLVSKLNPF